jgi:SOS response regulatory protein OraA/RecX
MYYELEYVSRDIYRMNLDNGISYEFHTVVLDTLGLWTNNTILPDTIYEALKEERRYHLKKIAAKFLEKRAYSYKELFDKLYKYENDCSIRHSVMHQLEELGLIDDDDYAKRCAYHYMHIKNCSIKEAKNKMVYTKGIRKSLAEDALMEYDTQERENLKYLIEHKYGRRIEDFSDFKQLRKIRLSLYRLGFYTEDIDIALNEYRDEVEGE